jgi:WD40 repeat protein
MIRSIVPKWLALRLGVAVLGVAVLGAVQAQEGAKSAATDRNGDPLPAGALARLGSLRWRHAEPILFVAFAQEGKAVLTGGQDQVFRLWNRATGAEIRHFTIPSNPQGKPGKPRPVAAPWTQHAPVIASVTQDGKTLAVSLPSNEILLWDVEIGKEIRRITPPQSPAAGLQFSPDGKLLATRCNNNSGVIFLLDPANGKEVRQVKPEIPADGGVRQFGLGMASSLAFSPDSKLLAVGEAEFDQQKWHYYVRINDVDTGKEIIKIDTTTTNATSVAFSADAKQIAIGNFNSIVLREPTTGKEIRTITQANGVTGVVFAPRGTTLAVRGRDHQIRLIDSETGKQLHLLTESGAALGDNLPGTIIRIGIPNVPRAELAFAPDGKSLAVASGNTLRIWDTLTGKEQPLSGGHRGPITNLGVSADGKTALTRGADGMIRRWDLTDGRQLGEFGEPSSTTAIAFSPDGKWAAFGTGGLIKLCDTETGKSIKELPGHAKLTATLAFSPDSKWLASFGMSDNTLHFYDLARADFAKADGSVKVEPRAISLGDNPQPGGGFVILGSAIFGSGIHLAFSADSKSIAVQTSPTGQPGITVNIVNGPGALPEPKIRMWDVATGKELRQFPLALPSGGGTIAASRDGRLIATENSNQTATLWEVVSGQPRRRLGKADPSIGQVSRSIGVGLGQGTVVPRAPNPATTIAFSPDGRLFADGGADHAVRVWDITAGKEVGEFKGHQGSITALAFSPDSRRLITGSSDTTLLVWDVGTLKPVPAAAGAELQEGDCETCWTALLTIDGEKAYDAILKLAGSPRLAVPYLAERIKPATPADPSKLKKLIGELDSDDFTERANATEELEKLGELAVPALQKVLTGQPTPTLEFRRRAEPMVARLIGGALNAEQVRLMRALEVLERSGTPAARHLLELLAKGAPGALVTRKAQESLERIAR